MPVLTAHALFEAGRIGAVGKHRGVVITFQEQRVETIQHLVAAHLSDKNNHPDLARAALASALACDASDIRVADQEAGVPWISLN